MDSGSFDHYLTGNQENFDKDSECSNSVNKKSVIEEYPFQVISTNEIFHYMVEYIKEVNSVLEMPETTTRMLLQHFKWDKQKLLDRFYDSDQDQMFKDARIANPSKISCDSRTNFPKQKFLTDQSSLDIEEVCEICCASVSVTKFTELECGHRFCEKCWNEYLKNKIMDEGIASTIACAASNCEILVDDNTVMKLLEDRSVKKKYEKLITNSFVQYNKLIRWCPRAGCTKAIIVEYLDTRPVKCKCQYTFCFECGEKWHEPVSCDLLLRWDRMVRDSIKTKNWIVNHTKSCPKCNSNIEKNGGCSQMKCKVCEAVFCWDCLKTGPIHHFMDCESFQGEPIEVKQNSDGTLDRFMLHFDKYYSYFISPRIEKKLNNAIKRKMEAIAKHKMRWVEVQFLKKAHDTLISCRQTLMFSHIMAYYLDECNNQTLIFEANQRHLDDAVKKLSEYLERDIFKNNLAFMKESIQNLYIYCENRRKKLLEHVHEGHEKEWWHFQE